LPSHYSIIPQPDGRWGVFLYCPLQIPNKTLDNYLECTTIVPRSHLANALASSLFSTFLLQYGPRSGTSKSRKEIAMLGRKSPSLRQAVVLASLSLSCCLSGFAQSRMTVRREVHRDVSPPLREMIKLTPKPSLVKHEASQPAAFPLPPGLSILEEDPIRQQTAAPFTPVVGTSFEGLGAGQYGFSVTGAPPDTQRHCPAPRSMCRRSTRHSPSSTRLREP